MLSPYQFTSYTVPMFASGAFTAILLVYVWNRSSVPGATPLGVFLLCMTLWATGATMEQAAVDIPTKIIWIKFQGIWPLFCITAQLCFALEYANLSRWLTRRTTILWTIPLLVATSLMITNDLHVLIWPAFLYEGYVRPLLGVGGWIFTGYGLLLGFVTLLVLLWLFIQSPMHRVPVAFFLMGPVMASMAYALNALDLNPVVPMDPTVLMQTLISAMYALALFRFRMFEVLPVARETVINQMREGMVVLDAQQQIVDLNPPAEKILSEPSARLRGRKISHVLPACPNLINDSSKSEFEIVLGQGANAQDYQLHLSRLGKPDMAALGYVLMFYNVTEQKRTQAQLVEQQRVLATLEERERLARELHDTLVQSTAAIRMQAEMAEMFLRGGEPVAGQACLTKLADMAQEMHLDLREYLFSSCWKIQF